MVSKSFGVELPLNPSFKSLSEMDKPIENATTSNNIRIRGYSSNYKTTSIGSIGYGINNVPIQFKKIKITSSMYVKFSIQ